MPDCTRCGTATNRPALSFDSVMKSDPLRNFTDINGEETNGIVWLCDTCIEDLKSFFLGEKIPGCYHG